MIKHNLPMNAAALPRLLFLFAGVRSMEPLRDLEHCRCRVPVWLISFIACAALSATLTSAGADVSKSVAGPTLAPMLEKVLPAVVHVETEATVLVERRTPFDDPFFRRFFGEPPRQQQRKRGGFGSGVIIDADKGHVITNSHVIAKAHNIVVALADGRRFEAEVVGSDPGTDIAILKIDAEDFIAIRIGDSEVLRVGDFVVAIGNPFGLGQSVTSGIVSGLGRSGLGIESYEDFIQTDAPINPGNSGGALINLRGDLIGINTAILGPNGNIGIGFAIPVNMAMDVAEQLLEFGEVKRGLLGVSIQTLTPDLAKAFNAERDDGVVITMVSPDSAAERAGLEAGDIVLSINGKPTNTVADMRNFIGLLRIGSKITLEVLRGDNKMDITAVISDRKKTLLKGGEVDQRLAGILLQVVETDGHALRGDTILVKEIKTGSRVYRYGLREGDLIVAVNRRRVENFSEFRRALVRGRPILLRVHRGDRSLFLAVK